MLSIRPPGPFRGRLTLRLANEFARSRVVGCDFSRGMLAQARARSEALALARGDAQHLPFAAGAFDAVVSTEAFHWFPDPDAALAGFRRVLAPGGRLLVAFVNPPAESLSRLARKVSLWLDEPLRWPTPAALRRQLEIAGFEVASQRRIFRLPAPLLFPPVSPRRDALTEAAPHPRAAFAGGLRSSASSRASSWRCSRASFSSPCGATGGAR